MKENFHSINGDISMRACMFCGRNLFTSIHYRYCSTELHRKSDSLICYKCEQASKNGKLKSVIEKLRKVLKIRPEPRPLGSTVQLLTVFSLATVKGGTLSHRWHYNTKTLWWNIFLYDVAVFPVSKVNWVLHISLYHFRTNIRIAYQNATVANTHVVCKYCQKVCFDENEIKSDALLKKHILEEHPFMDLHQCALCCFDTTNEIEFNWHLVTYHLNPESTECSLCHIKFRSKQALIRHSDVHFKPKQQQKLIKKRKTFANGHLKCRYCPKYFLMAYNRIQHEKMAHSKTQKCTRKYTCEWFKYKCSLCKLRFMSRKDKLNHELGFHCLKRHGSNFILKFYSHHLRPILIFSQR